MTNGSTSKHYLKACVVGVSMFVGSNAFGQEFAASEQIPFDFLVVNEGLPEVIQYLSAHAAIRTQMADSVQGRLRLRHLVGTPQEILDDLTLDHDLDWFAFNGTYYVDTKQSTKTRIIPLGELSFERAIAALEQAEVPVRQYPISSAADGKAMVMSGPPKLIGIVEALVASTTVDVEALPQVRVRRGNQINGNAENEPISN